MYKLFEEIEEQPRLFLKLWELEKENIYNIVERLKAKNPKQIIITGCGDAYANAMLCKEYFRKYTNFDIICEEAFEIVYNPNIKLKKGTVAIVFSAKGSSKMILKAIQIMKEKQIEIVCVTNQPDSQAALLSDSKVLIHAGKWEAPRTKVITLSALVSLVLAAAFGDEAIEKLERMVCNLVDVTNEIVADIGKWSQVIDNIREQDAFTFVGYGYNYPAVYYAKAKSKEILRWRSDIYQIEEFAHIETVAPSPGLFTVFLMDECINEERVMETLRAAIEMHRVTIVFTVDSIRLKYKENYPEIRWITVPDVKDEILSILHFINIQLLHYVTAGKMGIDPDNPPTRLYARSVAFDKEC